MTLKRRYDRIMEHIEVTDDMRRRVLQNLREAQAREAGEAGQEAPAPSPGGRRSAWKRYLPLAACLAVVVAVGAVTLPHQQGQDQAAGPVLTGSAVVDCSSADKLSQVVNFTVEDLEGLPFQVEQRDYTAYQAELAEITYSGEDQTAVFRKSPGSGDISGNYEDFETVSEVSVSPYVVTLKGQAGAYRLALWSDGEFAYSLQFSSALPEQDWVDLLAVIAAAQ